MAIAQIYDAPLTQRTKELFVSSAKIVDSSAGQVSVIRSKLPLAIRLEILRYLCVVPNQISQDPEASANDEMFGESNKTGEQYALLMRDIGNVNLAYEFAGLITLSEVLLEGAGVDDKILPLMVLCRLTVEELNALPNDLQRKLLVSRLRDQLVRFIASAPPQLFGFSSRSKLLCPRCLENRSSLECPLVISLRTQSWRQEQPKTEVYVPEDNMGRCFGCLAGELEATYAKSFAQHSDSKLRETEIDIQEEFTIGSTLPPLPDTECIELLRAYMQLYFFEYFPRKVAQRWHPQTEHGGIMQLPWQMISSCPLFLAQFLSKSCERAPRNRGLKLPRDLDRTKLNKLATADEWRYLRQNQMDDTLLCYMKWFCERRIDTKTTPSSARQARTLFHQVSVPGLSSNHSASILSHILASSQISETAFRKSFSCLVDCTLIDVASQAQAQFLPLFLRSMNMIEEAEVFDEGSTYRFNDASAEGSFEELEEFGKWICKTNTDMVARTGTREPPRRRNNAKSVLLRIVKRQLHPQSPDNILKCMEILNARREDEIQSTSDPQSGPVSTMLTSSLSQRLIEEAKYVLRHKAAKLENQVACPQLFAPLVKKYEEYIQQVGLDIAGEEAPQQLIETANAQPELSPSADLFCKLKESLGGLCFVKKELLDWSECQSVLEASRSGESLRGCFWILLWVCHSAVYQLESQRIAILQAVRKTES